ncbi:UDP-Glycosyltransferase/glycogen phosphorylase [Lichtheimia hyalospora FSU 10163]|nr:UDP-Glycosyltransferase/glycogen phosphorylase [Lichtheimia hyalospora FSU 10163]
MLITSILWVVANLFMVAVANSSDQQVARGLNDIMQELHPFTHFQNSPKNIMFGVSMGGSSHHSWVMRVLDELDRRGHKITYATTKNNLRFSRQRPHIKGISIGDTVVEANNSTYHTMTPMPFNAIADIVDLTARNYPSYYHAFRQVIESQAIDVVLCDHISFACIQAAKKTKRPLIISMMINESPESDLAYINKSPFTMVESNTEHLSYSHRFYEQFIWPIQLLWHAGPNMCRYIYTLHSLGLGLNPKDGWEDAVKLVNNLYGFDDPRPMGPLVELVGPIYNDHFDKLTPELASFLDTHKRVVYVGFGQHTQSKDHQESTRVLQMLLNNYEAGVLDAFIWSATKGTPLPDHVTTSSGTQYQLSSTKFTSIGKIVPWAPQMAILRHPSVISFVSHAGIMSLFEAMYQGKRILAYPFMTDQFANAKLIERTGAGLWLTPTEDRLDVHHMTEKLRRVVKDEDGSMQKAVNKYQALLQIHGQNSVDRAANIVEEVVFTADSQGHLPHRRDIARNLSFFKRNNYDLYLGLLALVAVTIISTGYLVRLFIQQQSKQDIKMKTQ